MNLADQLKKRANYSAVFSIKFIDREALSKLEQLGKEKEDGLPDEEVERFIDAYSWLTLRISRLSDVEVSRAREEALQSVLPDKEQNDISGLRQKSLTVKQLVQFNTIHRDALWGFLLRHIEGATDENGEVDRKSLIEFLDLLTLEEIGFIVGRYMYLASKDREQAEGNPSTLEKDS